MIKDVIIWSQLSPDLSEQWLGCRRLRNRLMFTGGSVLKDRSPGTRILAPVRYTWQVAPHSSLRHNQNKALQT